MFHLQEELENTSTLDAIAEWSITEGIDVPSASGNQVSQALNRGSQLQRVLEDKH